MSLFKEALGEVVDEQIKYMVEHPLGFLFHRIVLPAVGSITFLGCSFLINSAVLKKTYAATDETMAGKNQQIGETIATKTGLHSFDVSSMQLTKSGERFLMEAFGTTKVVDEFGRLSNEYANATFCITDEAAKEIVDALQKLEENNFTTNKNSDEHFLHINDRDKGYATLWASNKKIKEASQICEGVYDAIEAALEKAMVQNVSLVGDTVAMDEAAQCASGFSGSKMWVTGVTTVARNEEQNVCYFYVDSLQGTLEKKKLDVDSCRTCVVVEGSNLSDAEAYAKFIAGQYKQAFEIAREKTGVSTSIVDACMQAEVYEMEMKMMI